MFAAAVERYVPAFLFDIRPGRIIRALFFFCSEAYVCRMVQLFFLSVLYFFIACYAVSAAMSVIGYCLKSRERKRRVKWYRKQRMRG